MALSKEDFDGDYRQSLAAQRDDLVERLQSAGDREAVGLHRQLTIILEKLDKLPSGEEVTPLDKIAGSVSDELARRRAGRVAGAADSSGAAG